MSATGWARASDGADWLARQRTDAGPVHPAARRTGPRAPGRGRDLVVLASLVAPGIFHEHLVEAGVGHSSAEAAHVEEAFGSALIISMAVASDDLGPHGPDGDRLLHPPVQRSTTHVSTRRVPDRRDSSARASPAGSGPEFDQLATTINDLAERLGDVEDTRASLPTSPTRCMPRSRRSRLTWRPSRTASGRLTSRPGGATRRHPATAPPRRGHQCRLTRRGGPAGLRPVRTHPRELLEAAAAAAQDAYDSGQVRLTVDDTGPLPDIHVDPERMGQVRRTCSRTPYATPHPVGRSTSRQPPRQRLGGAGRHRHRRGIAPSTSPRLRTVLPGRTPPGAANPAAAAASA